MRNTIVILIIVFLLSFGLKKFMGGKISKGLNMFTESDARAAILAVKAKYGEGLARTVEKMMRLETRHFKSVQYQKTGTAGMTPGKWSGVPKNLPTIEVDSPTTTFKDKYLVWNPKDFALFLAAYIVKYNLDFARWNSLDPIAQQKYRASVQSVKCQFV